jgi:hypothetical protein
MRVELIALSLDIFWLRQASTDHQLVTKISPTAVSKVALAACSDTAHV